MDTTDARPRSGKPLLAALQPCPHCTRKVSEAKLTAHLWKHWDDGDRGRLTRVQLRAKLFPPGLLSAADQPPAEVIPASGKKPSLGALNGCPHCTARVRASQMQAHLVASHARELSRDQLRALAASGAYTPQQLVAAVLKKVPTKGNFASGVSEARTPASDHTWATPKRRPR